MIIRYYFRKWSIIAQPQLDITLKPITISMNNYSDHSLKLN